ncbi:MAG: outer membrane lipoprotein-sorting protein [Proteobacteria bacterium]|nr:MAG: outer membrane lipoprotein-sorting protein [Pseudomonadota bacterium]PIE40486.1 MAG: outer membrane lipoprotein-sorting protein [Gammaproteobacteria bacterium]
MITSAIVAARTIVVASTILCASTVAISAPATGNQEAALDGLEIMKKVDARDDGETRTSETTMTLTNRHGSQRVRKLVSYSKDYPGETRTLIVFLKPNDVKGVANLNYEYDALDKEDDTWLYLPALRKAKRIAGSSRNDYFMGTDFTYDDMGDRQPEEDTHTLLREESREGVACWVVESVPLEKNSMYSKRISWIDKNSLVVRYVEYYDRQGKLLKLLRTDKIEKIEGYWSVGLMEMHNVQDKHRTLIENHQIHFNRPVEDGRFRVSTLERGRIR